LVVGGWWSVSGLLVQGPGYGIEAVEKAMMAQPEGFTLHFKIPAVLPRSRAQAFVLVGIG